MSVLMKDEAARWLESPWLAGVDDPAKRAIYRKLQAGQAETGTPLLSQGEPNDRLWFVAEGSVVIERQQADGHIDLMASMSGPAVFGTTTFFRSTVPSASIRAASPLTLWTLDRAGHESLRRDDPRAAEALALAIVRVLSERFDLLDVRIAELMSEHGHDHPRATEWADFHSRLFEDS